MSITSKQFIAEVQLEALRQVREELDEEITRLERVVDLGDLPAQGTFTEELTTAIYDILLEERPLRRQTILERLAEREIYVGGKDSLRTLSAHLSNDNRFKAESDRRGYWTLKYPPENEEGIVGTVQEPSAENNLMPQPMTIAIQEADHMFRQRHVERTG